MNILNSDRISLTLQDWRLQFGILTKHFFSNYLGHNQLGGLVQYIFTANSFVHSAKNESIIVGVVMEFRPRLQSTHPFNSWIAVFIGMLINI